MILFTCLKKEFIAYIDKKIISNKIYDAYKAKIGKKTKLNQIKSWAHSLPFMKELLEYVPDDVGIALEYQIPYTSKMIDLVITGYNEYNKPIALIFELKGWEYTKNVPNRDAIIKTLIGPQEKNALHPSYQVLSYLNLLTNYNINIEKYNIELVPIVYLHNYNLTYDDPLYNKKFYPYYSKARMYGKNTKEELKTKITSYLKYGDNLKLINIMQSSATKPTKKLIDVLEQVLKTNKEFILLDEQKIIMESISKEAYTSFIENKKTTIIIKGGPGTGKTILALNALANLLSLGLRGSYVSKNMAPRKVYKLKLEEKLTNLSINELFRSSGAFYKDKSDVNDFLLIDEAHRLQEKSGLHNNIGENQIKEIINASKINIFFIDESQIITLKDIGTIANIKHYAKHFNSKIIEHELTCEFRCNGSSSYLSFINAFLTNKREKPNFNFDFQVLPNPSVLYDLIKQKNTNNNARLVAGFCWPRIGKYADNQNYHDINIENLSLSWNLKHGLPFAIRPNAINEIGCVHNVQGLEFDYIGVIIGPDLYYEKGKVKTNYKKRANTEKSLYGLQTLIKKDKEYYENLADILIRNTYRVLLTRGIKGCYVYCTDKNLNTYLQKLVKNKSQIINI